MKNIITRTWLLLSVGLFLGCERDLETEGISRITFYPDFVMAGEENVITWVGAPAFTDPGVTATEAGNSLPVTVTVTGSPYIVAGNTQPSQVQYTSSFDANVPGIYTFTYSAINSDGFPGSITRQVFVLDKQPDPAVDLSGAYTSATSPEAEITKIGDGVFYSTNAWGGGSTVRIGAYILTSDGMNLNVPQQESLVRIFGYGTRTADGTLNLKMSRPTFAPPLIDLDKIWVKK